MRIQRMVFIGMAAIGSNAFAVEVEVEVAGLPPELERNVRAHLSIAELEADAAAGAERAGGPEEGEEDEEDEEADVAESRVRRLHAAAPDEIEAALQPFGYYSPEISATLTPSGDTWVARYEVELGPPVRVTAVDVRATGEGSDAAPVRAALAATSIRTGDVLNHPRYEAAKQRLFNAAYGAGYIDATYVRSQILVDRAEEEAEIHLVLDTGPRYYFGELTVEQNILYESFVERFVPIEYGDPFDTDRLLALQIALNDSGYFSEVAVDVQRERATNRHIPVVVFTEPRDTQEYTLGIGYGTDTGPRVSIGIELRRLNPRGHRFTSDLRLSNIEQAVAFEYRIPARNLATDYLAFRGALGTQEVGGWDTSQVSLGAIWNDAWRQLQRRVYLTAAREEFSTAFVETNTANALFAGIQLTSNQADDQLHPRKGYSWSVDVRGGAEALLSSTTFGRLHATGRVVRSLGERIRILLRGEYGAIRAGEFSRLPPSQRFYAGGDSSVRGYGYQELSPVDANGARIGGRYAFTASAELEIMLVGDYGAAVFFDAGNASDDRLPDPKRGVGIGARWRSPVGVVGLDVAHPLDDPENDYRLHLSVGGNL